MNITVFLLLHRKLMYFLFLFYGRFTDTIYPLEEFR